MQRVFITGITSFTGRYLTAALERSGYECWGISQIPPFSKRTIEGDLTNRESLVIALAEAKPHFIIHLAAKTFVGDSDEEAFFSVNLFGTQNLLSAIEIAKLTPEKVILCSSANIYGDAEKIPIPETLCPSPVNHYAISKLAMEHMALNWPRNYPIILVRPFNYTGSGQDLEFLIPKIVDHFRRRASIIELGNLHVSRDFSDVRMICSAYEGILQNREIEDGETFNICSGIPHSLSQILEILQNISGHTIEVRVNPDFVRKNEIKLLLGDNQKLFKYVKNLTTIPFEQTLKEMYSAPSDNVE